MKKSHGLKEDNDGDLNLTVLLGSLQNRSSIQNEDYYFSIGDYNKARELIIVNHRKMIFSRLSRAMLAARLRPIDDDYSSIYENPDIEIETDKVIDSAWKGWCRIVDEKKNSYPFRTFLNRVVINSIYNICRSIATRTKTHKILTYTDNLPTQRENLELYAMARIILDTVKKRIAEDESIKDHEIKILILIFLYEYGMNPSEIHKALEEMGIKSYSYYKVSEAINKELKPMIFDAKSKIKVK